MAFWFDIESVTSPLVRALHGYWDRRRGARSLPARSDIDPAEIKNLLPYVLISELMGELPRVRYRLVGTTAAAASGVDLTGRFLDEMVAADVEDEWQSHYTRVRNERRPLFGTANVPRLDDELLCYAFGIFPLSDGGDAVAQCIAIEDYGTMNQRLGELQDKAQPWHYRPIRLKTPS